jgi:prepilin-type N-terminal cleavage/methylation domain-containing protein
VKRVRLTLHIVRWKLKYQNGMSLVEVLVAMAILGVCAAVFVGGLSSGAISTRILEEQVIARNLAQSQIETLKTTAYDAYGASYAAISAPTGYAITISANPTIYTDTNIQKLTVTVKHNNNLVLTLEDFKVNR